IKSPKARLFHQWLSREKCPFFLVSYSMAFERVLGIVGPVAPKLRPKTRPADMPKKKLSAIAIPSLRGGRHHDHVIPGLEITVGNNRRTWTYRYRIGGRNPRQKLGYFPSMGLQAARDAARKLIDRLESGAAPQPAPVHPRSALTLGALIDRYETLRQSE